MFLSSHAHIEVECICQDTVLESVVSLVQTTRNIVHQYNKTYDKLLSLLVIMAGVSTNMKFVCCPSAVITVVQFGSGTFLLVC